MSQIEPPAIERHPLQPFLPDGCRLLFLGSFPPPQSRWSMPFFYPNFSNDHWRIEGLVFFSDRNRFVDNVRRCYKLDDIIAFLRERGIGFYDTARAVRRLADNASDKFLEVVEPTDVRALVAQAPALKAIAVTGEKACETLCAQLGLVETIKVGGVAHTMIDGRAIDIYRLPSSSRAYPLALEKKAEAYRRMFVALGMATVTEEG